MRTVLLSSILALFFMLFTSNLYEHDLLYIMHSHQTTSHSPAAPFLQVTIAWFCQSITITLGDIRMPHDNYQGYGTVTSFVIQLNTWSNLGKTV